MSLQTHNKEDFKRIASRGVIRTRNAFLKALKEAKIENPQLSQTSIAKALGVNKSVVSRELGGGVNFTVGRIYQLALAIGRDVEVSFPKYKPRRNESNSFHSINVACIQITKDFSHSSISHVDEKASFAWGVN